MDKLAWSVTQTPYGVEAVVKARDCYVKLMYRAEEMTSPRVWGHIKGRVRALAEFASNWHDMETPDEHTLNALVAQMRALCEWCDVPADGRYSGLQVN